MDIGWQQVLTIVGANVVLIIGTISLAITLYLSNKNDIKDFHKTLADIHGRVCTLEEKSKKSQLVK